MKLKQLIGLISLVALVALGVAFGLKRADNQTPQTNKLNVVASFYPLYDFAKQVGGNKVSVTNVTPADAEPHDYEPSPRQLVTASKSTIFIYDGATLEPWVNKFLPNFKQSVVKASNGVELKQGQDENGFMSAEIKDPHFWLDPELAGKVVDNIATGFSKADPQNGGYYRQRAYAYRAKLTVLDNEFKNGLRTCQRRDIITSHAAFGYLGMRYNLTVYSIAGVTPDEEPSAAKLAELSRLVKDKGITTVFFESLVSPKLAQTIANETGAKTAVFDPIEGISDNDQAKGKDYLSVQRDNLVSLRSALACQ